MDIGIVGGGVVGKALARCYMEHANVMIYDRVPERRTHSLFETLRASVVFLCLPTPQYGSERLSERTVEPEGPSSALGSHYPPSPSNPSCNPTLPSTLPDDIRQLEADISPISIFLSENNTALKSVPCLVIRSTVPIGTTREFRTRYNLPNLIHSPEFLTARCAATDAMTPSRNIVGGPSGKSRSILVNLYRQRFPGIHWYVMTSDESEAVKVFQNGFFAVKIGYFNEVYCLSQSLGLQWSVVLNAMLADGRIAHSHTRVPGPDGTRGWGGSCLPKDLSSLVYQLEKAGQLSYITRGALERNKADHGNR